MTKINVFRIIILILIFFFLILYFMQTSGYSEYVRNKDNMLTYSDIKEFEDDIKNNKDVTVNNYLKKNKVNYENNFSKMGLKISYLIEDIFNKGMDNFFNLLNDAITS